MTNYAMTPEQMHQFIDKMVEGGVKAFVFSGDCDGEWKIPTKRRKHYVMPLILSAHLFKDNSMMNVFGSKGQAGSLLMVMDPNCLSDEVLKVMETGGTAELGGE